MNALILGPRTLGSSYLGAIIHSVYFWAGTGRFVYHIFVTGLFDLPSEIICFVLDYFPFTLVYFALERRGNSASQSLLLTRLFCLVYIKLTATLGDGYIGLHKIAFEKA